MSLSKKTGNKLHRQSLYVRQKREREKERREARFRRKKEEAQDPELRRVRVERNKPASLDRKRVWDDVDLDDDSLGAAVDMEQLIKRRRLAQEEAEEEEERRRNAVVEGDGDENEDDDDDKESVEDALTQGSFVLRSCL